MKKLVDLPIYFIIGGLILNIIMFFYNEVSFTDLMIRSSLITLLFAATGYFLASVLREARLALKKKKIENTGSIIDIRVNSEDDDELLNLLPNKLDEEFSEINLNNFNKLMDQDRF